MGRSRQRDVALARALREPGNRVLALTLLSIALAVLAGLVLTACTLWPAAPEHGRLVREPARVLNGRTIPAIEWPRGLPDDGRWTGDPWVEVVRGFAVVYPAVYNTRDLANDDALEVYATSGFAWDSQQELDSRLRIAEHRPHETWGTVYPGPLPFEVLSVVEDGREAVVRACLLDVRVAEGETPPDELPAVTTGNLVEWKLFRSDDHGTQVYVSRHGAPCQTSNLRYGLFVGEDVADSAAGSARD